MRILHRSALIRGLVLAALTAGAAWAQPPRTGTTQMASQLPQGGMAAPPAGYLYDPAAGACPPGVDPAAYYQQGAMPPPGAGFGGGEVYPWPAVSPFDHRFDQTVQEQGLWTRYINDSQRKYSAGFDWINNWYAKPGGAGNEADKQIGFPVKLALTSRRVPLDDEWQDFPLNFIYDPIQPINSPDRIYRWNAVQDDLDARGVQGFFNWEEADQSGAEASGFWGGKAHQEVDFPFQPRREDSLLFPDRSAVINRVRLSDGTLSLVPLLFVTSLSATYEAASFGAEANLISTPLLGRDSNRLRMYYGLRYMNVHERFDLIGVDLRPPEPLITNREFSAVFSGFGGTYGGTTYVRTSVDTHLFGPQLGFRWDLGGDKFKLKSWLVGAPLANLDVIRIYYQNYGAIPGPGLTGDPKERHSHISPLLEAGIQGDIPLFGYLPVLKKTPIIRDAVLRVGYKYTAVFLMDRPVDSITWGDPHPVIDSDREQWHMGSLNVGMRWDW